MHSSSPITLILDGFFGSHQRWESLCRLLDASGNPSEIWTYSNTGRKSLEELGTQLATHIQSIRHPVHLVGYSMGGLVVREAIRQSPSLPIQKAALLCTPHHGSLTAWTLPLPAIRQIRPGSAFLKRLNAAPWSLPTLNVWCPADLMVFPGRSAYWEKASHSYCCLIPAHAWPVYSKTIQKKIARFLVSSSP